MNRKRSHDDLDDADECLPISKRINSLHLEGAQGLCHSQHQVSATSLFNGFPHNTHNHQQTLISPQASHGSALPFPSHQQQSDIPLSHHHHHHSPTGADKSHGLPTISTDYNYNISSSNPHAHTYSHHPLSHNGYHGDVNLDGARFSHDNSQSFPCDNNHNLLGVGQHHHQQQHHEQNLNAFHPAQTSAPLMHHQIPMSSCQDVNLVNQPYNAPNISNVGHHQNVSSINTAITNLADHDFPLMLGDPEELPKGPYDPELAMAENPHYYNNNKLLYEAHVSRLQRIIPDYQLHS